MKEAYQLVMVNVGDDDLDGGVYDWIKRELWDLRRHIRVESADKDFIHDGFQLKLWVRAEYLEIFWKILQKDV